MPTVKNVGEIMMSPGDVDALGAAGERISGHLLPEPSVAVDEAAFAFPKEAEH